MLIDDNFFNTNRREVGISQEHNISVMAGTTINQPQKVSTQQHHVLPSMCSYYSQPHTPDEDMETACGIMDSDYVADPYQYGTPSLAQ